MKKLGKTTNMCFVAGTQVVVRGEDGEQATKPIEEIEPGDMVWSRSDLTGEQGFKPVLQTFVTRPVELVHLTYRRATGRAHGSAFRGAKSSESGDGDSDPDPSDDLSDKASAASEALAKSDSKLVGTPNHPFWSVTRQTWVEMGRLQPGERLLLADGREAVVETLEREYAPAVFENWTPGQAATGTLGTPADPISGTFTTYNFEVAGWHTYFVSDVGAAVWVHNQGALCPEIIEAAKRKPELVNKMKLDPQVRRELQEMGLLPRKQLRDERGRFVADPANPKSPYVYSDAQRRKDWKRIAEDPNSPLTPEQRQMVKDRGYRGPQRMNEYGELETMELSHEPTPLRHGGTNVEPRWPADHASVDPHRKLKNR